jgi:hypothetical protein
MSVDAQPVILDFRCVKRMAGYDPVLDQQYLALGGWNRDQATKCGSSAFIQNFCSFFSNSGRRQIPTGPYEQIIRGFEGTQANREQEP